MLKTMGEHGRKGDETCNSESELRSDGEEVKCDVELEDVEGGDGGGDGDGESAEEVVRGRVSVGFLFVICQRTC